MQSNTELALEEGAFGLPWFVGELCPLLASSDSADVIVSSVATNDRGQTERYWGFDHLGQVMMHLGLDKGQVKELRSML